MINISINNHKVAGVYLIKNIKNDKIYIGGTKNLYGRILSHRSSLKRNKHGNYRLQKEWKKYGEDSFESEILLICEPKKDIILIYEQLFIDYYKCYKKKNGYNIWKYAHSRKGTKARKISKMRMSKARLGKTRVFSEKGLEGMRQNCLNMSRNNIGSKRTLETRKKMSEVQKGKKHPNRKRGYIHSEETKRKLSIALTGKKFTDETKKKMSEAQKGKKHPGRKHTEERKQHMSEKMTGRFVSEETKRKMSISAKKRKKDSKGRFL